MWFLNQLKLIIFTTFIFLSLVHAAPETNLNILTFLRDNLGMTIVPRDGQNFSAERGDITVEVTYNEQGLYRLTMSHGDEVLFRSWGKDFNVGHDFFHFEVSDLESFLDFATCYLEYFSFMETTEWHRETVRFVHDTQGLEYFQVSSNKEQTYGIKIGTQRDLGTTDAIELNFMREKYEIYVVKIYLQDYVPAMGLPNNKSHGTSIGFNLGALEEYTLGVNLMQPHGTKLPLHPMFYKFIMWTMDYFHLSVLKFSNVWPNVLLDPRLFIRDLFTHRSGEYHGEKARSKELFLAIRWHNAPSEQDRERIADALTRAFERENFGRERRAEARAAEERTEDPRGMGESSRIEWLSARIRGFRGRTTK